MRANGPSLNDHQLRFVHKAAAALAPDLKDYFLTVVADHLAGAPTDHAVVEAVNIGLRRVLAYANGTDHRYDDEIHRRA